MTCSQDIKFHNNITLKTLTDYAKTFHFVRRHFYKKKYNNKLILSLQEQIIDKGFHQLLEKLYQKTSTEIAPKDSLELAVKEGQTVVVCYPCSSQKQKAIEAGPKEKSLTNVKAHIKCTSHKKNVPRWLETRQKKTAPVKEQHQIDEVETAMAQVEMNCPGHYDLVYVKGSASKSARLRCYFCSMLLTLFPERGSSANNITSHADTHKSTGSNKPLKRQMSMDTFCSVAKKSKMQTESS